MDSATIGSVFALALATLGIVAALIAYGALGNPDKKDAAPSLKTHRVLGWIFLAVFAGFFAAMLTRYVTYTDFDAKGVMHSTLALVVAILLALKVLIVRRGRKFYGSLVWFGTIVLALSVALTGIVSGRHLGKQLRKLPPVQSSMAGGPQAEIPTDLPNKMTEVEAKFATLCVQCHPLGQAIYGIHEYKTVDEWTTVIDRMRSRTDTITPASGEEIAEYMAQLAAE